MEVEEESAGPPTYQEVVYILREDGTIEEKFTLPDSVDEIAGENFSQDENIVTVADIMTPPANININAKTPTNYNTVTIVNERGEEITCPPTSVTLNEGGNMETQVFHLNGLEQLGFDDTATAVAGSNFSNSVLSQVPQQLMELDETVLNSENVNIFELDEGNDSIQLFSTPQSPNKFVINTINLNNSNFFSTNTNLRPSQPQTNYSFSLPRTYAKNLGSRKVQTLQTQGVSQLLLAHEISSLDHSSPIIIANARSVTPEELEWIKSPGDKDEFVDEANPDIITYGTVEVKTAKEQSVNYVYHDSSSSIPLHVSFVLEPEAKTEAETEDNVKLDNPLEPQPEEDVDGAIETSREVIENTMNLLEEQKKLEAEIDSELPKVKRKRRKWLWSSMGEGDELFRNFKRRPSKGRRWMCGVCYAWFEQKAQVDKHFHETHFKTAKFQKCRFCDKKFLARFLCLRHEKTHSTELTEPLKRYCIKRADGTGTLVPSSFFKQGRKLAPYSEGVTECLLRVLKRFKLLFYECTDCDLKFKSDVAARDHYDLAHAVQECMLCNERFHKMAQLEEHLSAVHEFYYLKSFPNDYWSLQDLLALEYEGKRDDTVASRVEFLHPYAKNPDLEPPERRNYYYYLKRMKAFESEEKSTRRSSSKFRFLRKKPEMPKLAPPPSPASTAAEKGEAAEDGPPSLKKESPYECKICYQTFPTDTEFSNHIKANHSYEVKPKPFPCTFCDKKFATHSNRKEHERIHTQEKNYVCPFCNKAFIQISNLKKHVTTHKDQNLKCNTCDKQFITKNSLILHQRAHAADRKFRCNLCDRAYNYASLLKRHMRIHTGECPYECDICFQPFHELVSLHYHRKKVHTGERPHKCDICGKAFILSSDLKKHSSVHNKTDPNAPQPAKTAKPGRLPRSKRSVEQNLIELKPIVEPKEETATFAISVEGPLAE